MSFQVLMIDDDTAFKRILETRLRSFLPDMVFTYFDNVTAARSHLQGTPRSAYDLVILDEHLPDGRGVELMQEGWFEELAVLSVSSDDSPEIPGAALRAGATFFLNKRQTSDPLFKPLVLGVIERNKLQRQLTEHRVSQAIMDTVKTLVSTLRHEINNPLGAVLGASFLLKRGPSTPSPEQEEAAQLVELSGKRIKHVLDQLCDAVRIEPVQKANQKVFHIPGDASWGGAGASTSEGKPTKLPAGQPTASAAGQAATNRAVPSGETERVASGSRGSATIDAVGRDSATHNSIAHERNSRDGPHPVSRDGPHPVSRDGPHPPQGQVLRAKLPEAKLNGDGTEKS